MNEAGRRLGAAFAAARIAAKMTQETLAARVGKHQSWVSRTEHGDLCYRMDEFIAVAHALQVDAGALLTQCYPGRRVAGPERAASVNSHEHQPLPDSGRVK